MQAGIESSWPLMNRFAASAMAGLLATVPMTAVMTILFQKLQQSHQYPLPPREITEVFVARVSGGRHFGNRPLTYLSLLAHFAYGAAAGATYPVCCRNPKHSALSGAIFGLAVWGVSYLGWLPAAHILRPATQHPPQRNALMLFAHLVWGAGTVVIAEAVKAQYRTDNRRWG